MHLAPPAIRPAAWRRAGDAVMMREDGVYLRVDATDSLGFVRRGSYEPFETSVLLALARPGSAVIDVGANVGFHTMQFAKAVGPTGRVFAFEPDADNARLLEHNVRTNGFSNVTVIRCAALDRSGIRRLYRSGDNQGDHRLYDSHDGRAAIEVECVTIDDVLRDLPIPISIVKLDTQGTEPSVVAGMSRTLARHPDAWLATELWPAGLALAGSSATEYVATLRALGDGLFRIDEPRRRLEPLDPGWLAATVTVERGNHTNVLVARMGG